ncbi:MAG: lipoprotein LpqH [Segniliparus sp.]|uniref:lipoprotein LpqH n=1 Tax=Segniliparus sp. TaxID=2804064 RepID=UPI003F2A24B4
MTNITLIPWRSIAAVAAATAACALLTSCGKDEASVTHATVAGQAVDATQHGTKIVATLDGKSLEAPGPYTCGAAGGMLSAASAPGKTPTVLIVIKQGSTEASAVTITPETGKSYTWAPGAPNGDVAVTKSGDTFTATGKLPELAFDPSGALHDFKIEATCPGIK